MRSIIISLGRELMLRLLFLLSARTPIGGWAPSHAAEPLLPAGGAAPRAVLKGAGGAGIVPRPLAFDGCETGIPRDDHGVSRDDIHDACPVRQLNRLQISRP